jgi:hypothetical protein
VGGALRIPNAGLATNSGISVVCVLGFTRGLRNSRVVAGRVHRVRLGDLWVRLIRCECAQFFE